MTDELSALGESARTDIGKAGSTEELRDVEVRYLGRRSRLNEILRDVRNLPDDQKRIVGPAGNRLKQDLERIVSERHDALARAEEERLLSTDRLDLTLPARTPARGAPHPLMETIRRIEDAFVGLGYEIAEGPLIEDDWHNFQALNIPPDHPARTLMDTYWLDGPRPALLRTHTSPVQIRVMESRRPPIHVICPGRAFRVDQPDATHLPVFHQVEGLAVDEGLTFGDLKGTVDVFAQAAFGPGRRSRLVPCYYQFTEPSCELQVSCPLCDARGCSQCASGWLAIGGAGMVDPNVFEFVGIDPERYTGFAFGLSPERSVMDRYGITDIRHLIDGDQRFVEQFRGMPVQ